MMNDESKKLTLEDLGYGPFFEGKRVEMKLDGFAVARVTSETKGAYKVKNADGEYINLSKTVVLLPYANGQKFIVIGVVI